jgi:fructokinase
VQAVDATGAGDAFMAGLLVGVLQEPTALEDSTGLGRICRFANAVGAITITGRGAIPSLPTRAVVTEFLTKQARA